MVLHRRTTELPPTASTAQPLPRWLRAMVVLAIVLGIALRFTNVSHKAYWLDEAFTSLHLSGYSDGEAVEQLVSGKIIPNSELQRFQYPSADKSALDSITHIALTAPELPPPYFVLLRGWVAAFGQTVTSIRMLSVAFGLLLLPAVYGLARLLFPGTWTGAIATALVALSPFHLLYAQEARPYSLWTLVIVLSYASLAWAMARPTPSRWALYSLTLALGLYCHLLHGLVFLSQAAFIWVRHSGASHLPDPTSSPRLSAGRHSPQSPLRAYGLASLAGLLLFAPWVLFALVNFANFQTAEPGAIAPDLALRPELIKGWLKGWNLAYLDFNFDDGAGRGPLLGLATLLGLNLVWMAVALVRFAQAAPPLAKQMLLTTLAVVAGLLILPDFLIGGDRSTAFRYWLPAILAGQLMAAFVLSGWLQLGPRHWGRGILAALLAMGLLSNIAMVMSWDWWSKDLANAHLDFPAVLRSHRADPSSSGQPPLFVSDQFFVFALSASHSLPAETHQDGTQDEAQWLLVEPGQAPQVPAAYDRFYLYGPSPSLLAQMESAYQVAPINAQLWQVTPPLP